MTPRRCEADFGGEVPEIVAVPDDNQSVQSGQLGSHSQSRLGLSSAVLLVTLVTIMITARVPCLECREKPQDKGTLVRMSGLGGYVYMRE